MISEVPIIDASNRLVHPSQARLKYDKYVAYANEPLCNLSCFHPEFGTYHVEGVDIFECLCKLRQILHERHNVYILCAGSRIDTYSSGAARNMSGGRVLFSYILGKFPTRDDEVRIFDLTTPNKVGSPEEQLRYHMDWLKSMNFI
ncbi:hypothetical protein [Pantanalinema sp. GBBB05]|uniref:hypothetical protein n=1 Tax=Pantanalinema sp. GBBB05 TaxID=2604139 RepID=UPI001DC95BAD|nr:hypothetical protein [Pantanalinema sp. GBBB05]